MIDRTKAIVRKLKDYINNKLDKKLWKAFSGMRQEGYLLETGWINSLRKGVPVDQFGEPLPWVTLPFISFISEKLYYDMKIFEFGCGNSTFFYSKKVSKVVSVEHDKGWFNYIKEKLPKNVSINHRKLVYGGEYSLFIGTLSEKFNLVIVDGRDRVNCMKNSLNFLLDDGVIILDNSERNEYREGVSYLLSKDFRKVDFWGMAPGLNSATCTTVFYRDNNCLKL